MTTPSDAIGLYIRAKDENRPHLVRRAFAPAATATLTAPPGAVPLPADMAGREAIADALVRGFGRAFENVYTFCLSDPPEMEADRFSCDWLVAMTGKDDRVLRVGCGRYDWTFVPSRPRLVERLAILLDRMERLPTGYTEPVMDWVSALPYPWCPPAIALAGAPDLDGLAAIRERIAADAR
ncbi:MAG: hypothetical protein AB7P02_15235 [Alphaproteobacteria bacterium]